MLELITNKESKRQKELRKTEDVVGCIMERQGEVQLQYDMFKAEKVKTSMERINQLRLQMKVNDRNNKRMDAEKKYNNDEVKRRKFGRRW